MEQKILKGIEKAIKSSAIINSYLEDYLKDDIDRIIVDNDLDINQTIEDNEPHIVGYHYDFDGTFYVTIVFYDECSESGIGIEKIDVDLTNFINWIDENC